jgi:hypothetical protein
MKGAQTDSRMARLADVSPAPIAASRRQPSFVERRHQAARQALNNRVHEEFVEMPGTCLTLAQASRLFGVPREPCQRILEELVANGQLLILANGRYRRQSAA